MMAPHPARELTFERPAFLASPVIHVARCDHPGSGLRLFFRIGGPGRQRRVEHRARSSMNNPRDSEALCIACVGARPVEAIGRASCRERVWQYGEMRVGGGSCKKKKDDEKVYIH